MILVGNIKKHKLVGSDVKAQGLQLFIVRKVSVCLCVSGKTVLSAVPQR